MSLNNPSQDIAELFKQYDTKHLPVVDRMVIDINRRLLKEKSLSLPFFQFPKASHRTAQEKTHKIRGKYPSLDEFYTRLNQDIQKRRVQSKLRQQIKKILDKQRYLPKALHLSTVCKPHIPHRYANEASEIEKIYGLPGEPI